MTKSRKLISIVLTICMAFTLLAGFEISASAAEVEVDIVSFLRGEQEDLRSSELLEARVTGYDGNVRELTYEWTNDISTYLYVYNDHNMYGINATAGEIEIYNSEVSASSNMAGRTYRNTFKGKGFAWAAIYGANYSNSDLVGTITVKVYDPKGNLLATDSHKGTRSGSWGRYVYSGFVADSLGADLQATTFGIFEGDSKLIKELFSEASIVHITCVESIVEDATVTEGGEFISLTKNNDGTYSVNALKNNADGGKISIEMKVTKDNCKFHQYSDGETTTTIHVYERPVPVPTTTTISLVASSIDKRCTYYINGVQGKEMPDGTVLFEGLTPNTTYTIEAQGHVEGTEVVYAYVPCTTLPVHVAQVVVHLDGGYNATTATAYGTLVDISEVSDNDDDLYIKEINGTTFIELERVSKGIYRVGAENGTYNIYHEKDDATIIGNQQLTMESADRTRYLFYYSVSYDANGGEGAPETAYYYEGDRAYVSRTVPTYEGYIFAGWKDGEDNIYQPGQLITADIEKPYKLTAIWQETTNVYVNVTLLHTDVGGSEINKDGGKHNVTFTVDGRDGEGDYLELADKTIVWDGVSELNAEGYSASLTGDKATDYTATAPTFTNVPKHAEYTFTAAKTGYELIAVTQTTDANGDIVINATLQYDVNNFDLVFSVELDEAAKGLPDELKPVAADVKVTAWYDSPYVDGNTVDWYPIMQHKDTYVKVNIDETGIGTGTFPVWATNLAENLTYYYRIEVTSFVLPDGSVMAAKDVDNAHMTYETEDKRYTAAVEVTGGAAPEGSVLDGAYYADGAQVGEVKAIISIEVFDVTFDPNGGQFSDGTTDNKVAKDQIAIPEFEPFVPTREGGYTFAGWYYKDTDEEAFENTVLFKDETLVAKWNAPRKIEGTVTVEGFYELDGAWHIIHDADRIHSATVLLQRLDANGYAVTIDRATVEITYDENIGTGAYAFDAVPFDGHSYRIYVAGANHVKLFQNEESASVTVTDYDAYDETHYYSAWGDDDVAMINALLKFAPEVFDLKYEIDATSIGEGFRPNDADVLVLYDDGLKGTNPQRWAVVSQMVHGDEVIGQNTSLVNGFGEDTYSVWQGTSDGAKFYDYAIRVTDVDGVEFNAQAAPFMIYYNGSARYSALTGQTQTLVAQIVPKMYTITFDLNAGDDTVTGMDSYETITGSYQDTYYWSYGKAITAKPVRDGYVFLGWFDENGNEVTGVDAAMHENITVTAQWQKLESYENDYAYIFGYNDVTMGAEGPLLRNELSAMVHRLVKQNGKLGGFVYNAGNPSFDDIAGQWFQSGIEYMNYVGAFPEGATSAYPYEEVTRGEAFKFICLGLGFTDDTTLTKQQYADLLYAAGYIEGDGSGDLKVADKITRAEFCTMYNRIIGRENALLIDTDGNEVTAETYGFTDMTDKEVWYYKNMVRATSAYEGEYVSIEKRGIRNVLDDYAG